MWADSSIKLHAGENGAMKLEKLTEKAREAIVSAGELAKEYNHSQVEIEHLLTELLEQDGGVVGQIVQKVGGDPAAARRAARSPDPVASAGRSRARATSTQPSSASH